MRKSHSVLSINQRRPLSRREFLASLAASMGALTLGPLVSACQAPAETAAPQPPAEAVQASPTSVSGQSLTQETPTPAIEPCTAGQPCASPTEAVSTAPPIATSEPLQASSGIPDLVVARGGEPEDLVRRSLAALGGIERFVPKGAWVIVKPNICVAYHSYEYAATTNPWVVGTLVKLCLEAGASKVQVMDLPFGGMPKEAYQVSGIQEQVEAAGGEMVVMTELKYVSTDLPRGLDIRQWSIYEDVLKADVFIDVPIAKHHNLPGLTLGMKNLMGVVLDRGGLHQNLGQRLADLTSRITPTLTVVDAVRILTANGPSGGNLDDVKKLDTVIASQDIVAADSYATTLFGKQPAEISYIRAGAEMGLGRMDLENLKIEEIAVGG